MTRLLPVWLLACALLVVASPLPRQRHGVHTIQGKARRSLAERAAARGLSLKQLKKAEKAAVVKKYARNNATHKRNLAKRSAAPIMKRAGSTVSLPLTDFVQQGIDELYYGTVSVGTPSQAITLDFDTGSSDLFVPNTQCTDCVNDGTLFNTAASSTYRQTTAPFQVEYGSGAVQGTVATDTVAFGNLSTTQYFGSVTRISETFDDDPASGLCGLAFQSISQIDEPNLAFNLGNQSLLAAKQFGFHLTRGGESGSSLTLGGISSNFSSATFGYTPVTSETYWEVFAAGLFAGGSNVYPQGFHVAVDTGTTTIYVPTAVATALYAAIPGAEEVSEGDYVIPCTYTGSVGVTFNNISTQFSISNADLNVGEVGEGYCQGSIAGVDIQDVDGNYFAIFGDSFLKNVYTVFDWSTSPARVGFTSITT